jgi:hypothetical protein
VYEADYEAMSLFAAGHNLSLIAQCVGFEVKFICQLEEEIMEETVISWSELHRIDPLLQFDAAYRDLVSRYITSTSRRFSDALKRVQNTTEFVLSLHLFVRGLTDPGNGCVVR